MISSGRLTSRYDSSPYCVDGAVAGAADARIALRDEGDDWFAHPLNRRESITSATCSKHVFVLVMLDLVQVGERALQLVLQVPHAQQALDAREQLEIVHRLADEIVGAAFAGLLDV